MTKEQKRRLNKEKMYEKQIREADRLARIRQDRIIEGWKLFNKVLGHMREKHSSEVDSDILTLGAIRDLYMELGMATKRMAQIELGLIAVDASLNADEVSLEIVQRYTLESLKTNLPERLASMRAELAKVKRDLSKEMRHARRAKVWLEKFEKHKPKTGHDSLDEMHQ